MSRTKKFPAGLRKRFAAFGALSTPRAIQDFLDSIPINFEPRGDTCRSPLMTLRHREAHCMEGAMLAAAALWCHGERPLLLDLRTAARDDDHVVALFQRDGMWGAISKTNHVVLRYRDPLYRDLRELAMSYFHEYFMDDGEKTLRAYSKRPFDLSELPERWLVSPRNVWFAAAALDAAPHEKIIKKSAAHRLRPAHRVERKAGKIVEWNNPR